MHVAYNRSGNSGNYNQRLKRLCLYVYGMYGTDQSSIGTLCHQSAVLLL